MRKLLFENNECHKQQSSSWNRRYCFVVFDNLRRKLTTTNEIIDYTGFIFTRLTDNSQLSKMYHQFTWKQKQTSKIQYKQTFNQMKSNKSWADFCLFLKRNEAELLKVGTHHFQVYRPDVANCSHFRLTVCMWVIPYLITSSYGFLISFLCFY